MTTPCRRLTLLLTDRCNLSCAYCYQGQKRPGRARMAWATAKAALDFMLANAPRPFSVEFSGGEPLLAPDLPQRCMDYLDSRRNAHDAISYGVTTNGTLLTTEVIDILASRDVRLRLSFDGPPGAQGFRGEGTYDRLDALIDEMRTRHSDWFSRRFGVNAVLHPRSLSIWAETARYLLAKSVPEILFYPAVGWPGEWSPAHADTLDRQAMKIADISAGRREKAAPTPVLFLRGQEPYEPPGDGAICGAAEGAGICVDSNGRAWACPFFTGSSSARSALRDEAALAMKLGEVRDRDLAERVGALPEKAAALRLMTHRREKFSSYGRCCDCEFLSECFLCPAAVSHQPGNMDPDKVPDFFCAYQRATVKARRLFQGRTRERARQCSRDKLSEALKDLRLSLERSL
jgi:MoaA/NifB/PqqE/SkfB family radical SAM enzyme